MLGVFCGEYIPTEETFCALSCASFLMKISLLISTGHVECFSPHGFKVIHLQHTYCGFARDFILNSEHS